MRKLKKIIFIILILLVFSFGTFVNSQDSCENPPPKETPGNDSPDDNFSYSDGNVKEYNLIPGAVVFTKGFFKEALKLYKGLIYNGEDYGKKLLDITPYIIIPTGALYGKENDSTFKYKLEEYVRLGGKIIVFAQQYGKHFDEVVPVPEGETLKSYGWREDQSCLKKCKRSIKSPL